MAKDEHAHGQQEEAKSRDNNILEEAENQIFGHGRYNPPSNPKEREQFHEGIKNAQNNPPKK
ncbi:MAG: hypothetical protein A3A08_01715 [Candidatus Nealsonbacteria bacterium RIFCSPLOWO2_01_FULL_41_9]|uniref:Uncharacterized protein n=1 Tax=Candidatus Nealsonbacteria bacterium RIFCSPLOWO2_01_FULL_41_9 TaxID=1801671 RepID=A0A1G2EDH1_9BACT|nr:MAG: hypothetical protein A3A08_01715 [Candidatus Nealsonbacteria bacterium RIFCSPLOWO2_01_FULL_41_9]